MYILSTIKYGIGNKLFMLVYLIYLYKNITQINKIYIVQNFIGKAVSSYLITMKF